jgi:hypothetical protein
MLYQRVRIELRVQFWIGFYTSRYALPSLVNFWAGCASVYATLSDAALEHFNLVHNR